MEIVVLVLLVLAIPVIAIVALVMTLNARERLRQVELRLTMLEAGLRAAPATAAAAPEPAPAPVSTETEKLVVEPPPAPAAAASAIPPPPIPPPPVPPRAAQTRAAATHAGAASTASASIEERFGTRWVVWIGGLALALGGIFLVRYSIEQGLLGPGVRTLIAALFAAALIAAGEAARRKDVVAGLSAIPAQHIPAILTAAGTVVAYATVYAAFALYGFLPAPVAFVLLGIVALATLAAALLHGPALAGLGVAGAFITPVLVPSDAPSYWALYLYLAIVTAAAFALARMRLWRWLAIAAVVLGALWTLPGIDYPQVDALGAHLFHVVAGFALAAALIVSGLLFGPAAEPGKIDGISSGALAAYLAAAMLLALGSLHDPAALATFAILTAATAAIVWRSDAALWALPAAGVMTIVVMLHWAVPDVLETLELPAGPARGAIPEPGAAVGLHLFMGAALAALFGLTGYAAQGRSHNPRTGLTWSIAAAAVPVAMLIALYLRIAEFDRSIPFAGLALALAALYGYATELLAKRAPQSGLAAGSAVFATGAVASLALALTFALDKGWLTVGLALMVPGIAWISGQRALPALRYLAAAVIVLVLLRIGYEPRIVGGDIGTTPIFNWLLYGYGVPAAAFWYAGYLLRQRADDVPARMADSAAILFTVLLALLEIRHVMNDGDIFRDSTGLAEVAMQVSVGLAMTIGLERLRVRSRSIVHNIGALIVGGLTLAAIWLGLFGAVNPWLVSTPVGGAAFNLVLLGYGIPAVLAAILSLTARDSRPDAYRYVMAATALLLALAYITLEIRTLFRGPVIAFWHTTSDAEQYSYSAAWLVFGVLLLVAGFFLQSRLARMASAAVVALTIAKVFLIDMAGLTGIFRALSFIGLGIVLVGIGWLYQRLLFPTPVKATTPGETGAEGDHG